MFSVERADHSLCSDQQSVTQAPAQGIQSATDTNISISRPKARRVCRHFCLFVAGCIYASPGFTFFFFFFFLRAQVNECSRVHDSLMTSSCYRGHAGTFGIPAHPPCPIRYNVGLCSPRAIVNCNLASDTASCNITCGACGCKWSTELRR